MHTTIPVASHSLPTTTLRIGRGRSRRVAHHRGIRSWRVTSDPPGLIQPSSDQLTAAIDLVVQSLLSVEPSDDFGELHRGREHLTDALTAASREHPLRPEDLCLLATVYQDLFRRTGDHELLEHGFHAISAEIDTVTSCPGATEVISLIMQVARDTFDADLLERAERLARQAITSTTADMCGPLRYLLTSMLLDRYEWHNDPKALEEALVEGDSAVRDATTSDDLYQLARALSVRAMARYTAQRSTVGPRRQLDNAVADAQAAVELARTARLDEGEYVNQLGMLLTERYDLVGDSADLDRAIGLLDEIVAHPLPADEFLSLATNLAHALWSRFGRDEDITDLDRGIRLMLAAIAATPPHSAQRAARHDAAGRLLAARDRLDEAQEQAALAVRSTPTQSSDHALYLSNRGMWVTRQWDLTQDEHDLDRAIELFEAALAAATTPGDPPPGDDATGAGGVLKATITYNLGARLMDRFDASLRHGLEDLGVLQRAADLLDDVVAAGYPHLTVWAGLRLGDIAWRSALWPQGEHAFRLARRALPTDVRRSTCSHRGRPRPY